MSLGCVRGCVRGSDFLSSADPRISGGCTINTPMPIYKERGKPSNNLHYLKLVLGNKSGQYIFFLHCTLRSHSCESSIGSMRPSLLLLCICIVSVAAWANRSNSSAGANGTISTDDNAAGGNSSGGSSGGGGGGDVCGCTSPVALLPPFQLDHDCARPLPSIGMLCATSRNRWAVLGTSPTITAVRCIRCHSSINICCLLY